MKRGLRVLVLGLVAAFALAAVPASAAGHEDRGDYLALGDSYAFAFNPIVFHEGLAGNPANFPGYTDAVATLLHMNLTNAACPGETSGSMISLGAVDNGCKAWRARLPLHTAYSGTQLDFAVSFLRSHPDTRLVTLQIGGNDFLLLQQSCANSIPCIVAGLPTVEEGMTQHLTTIYSKIRNDAHYRHTIVEVSYFAFNYNDANLSGIAKSLDATEAAVAAQFHARAARIFGEFKEASAPSGVPCLAGLQVVVGPGPICDIHPSAAGHAIYTDAVLDVTPRGEAVEAKD